VRRGVARSPLPWLAGLGVAYLAVPIIAFLIRLSGASQNGFSNPGLFPALFISLESATISLALMTITGVPLAYLLARSRGRIASFIGLAVQLPLALPPLMSGILLIYLVGPYTSLDQFFNGHLTMTLTGVVIAQTFVSAPFLIVAARAAFEAVDPALLDVAATLGHAEFSRFARVAVPVAAGGIRAGMLLAWLRAFGEYGSTVVLAYHPFSLPIYTYNQFSGIGLPTTLAPTALALAVAAIAVALGSIRRLPRRNREVALPAPLAPAAAVPTPVSFNVDHHLGAFHLSFEHEAAGNHLAVLGPSGSGKSALLRCLVGLYGAKPGPVRYGDRPMERVRVEKREVGYVAQGFGLYPHFTVWQHLLFAAGSTPPVAAFWLERLHLDGLQDRYPAQLSGGQRQRVGLAQALCRSPGLLVLDEPFSALDVPVRLELRRELRRLQRETGLATVLVTHDPEEAAFLSDEVMVVTGGRTLQSGPTREVFGRPASPAVAQLLGIPNLARAVVAAPGTLALSVDGVRIAAVEATQPVGTRVLWSIRPERIAVEDTPVENSAAENTATGAGLRATLDDVADVGTAFDLWLVLAGGTELQARTVAAPPVAVGAACVVSLPPEAISVWPDPDEDTA
jgi:molybdate transport system permease protein